MATKKTNKTDKTGSKKTVAVNKPAAKKAKPSVEGEKKTPTQKDSASTPVIKSAPIKPSQDEAMRLVTTVMNDFIVAKQEKSMEHFFHTISKIWQDMTSVEKLNAAFSVVISDETDWNFLKTIQPSLLKDGLSERGDWVVVGVYPTKPKKLIFDQIFVNENNAWKLAELKLFTSD